VSGVAPGLVATPVRALSAPTRDGCRVLSELGLAYRDGGELRVRELLVQAGDVSSTSDELLARAETWPERYHLDPARAHILRPLSLTRAASILEVGSGCGALTRYLGERCGVVDAVEPVPERALCIRERTRDLPNVEVFVGSLDDVPGDETYDVVVVVGVLEYVGGGNSDRSHHLEFLRSAARLLVPGGSLVLAIENALGVKYLCGAPEDHSGRPFEGVQGYEPSSPARTFSRRELEMLLLECGLKPTTLGLFPDYKLTRLIFGEEVVRCAPQLLAQIPDFPSPDWNGGGPRVADEGRVWGTLLRGGLALETANSYLMIGHKGDRESPLWPEGLLAAYYPTAGRRIDYATETFIVRESGVVRFARRCLAETVPDGPLHLQVRSEVLAEGEDMLHEMARTSSDEDLSAIITAWVTALDRALERDAAYAMDLMPHNALITRSGEVLFLDAKWDMSGYGREDILARAAFQCAKRLSALTAPNRWRFTTLESLTLHLGALAGLQPSADWLSRMVDQEALFQALVCTPRASDASLEDAVDRMRRGLTMLLASPLAGFSPADDAGKVATSGSTLERTTVALLQDLADAQTRVQDAESRIAAATEQLAAAASQNSEAEHQISTLTQKLGDAEERAAALTRELESVRRFPTTRFGGARRRPR
jgi:SAM-dependent methyltransferase